MTKLNAQLKRRLKRAGVNAAEIATMSAAQAVTHLSKLQSPTPPPAPVLRSRKFTFEGPKLETVSPETVRAAALRQLPYSEYLLTDYWKKTRQAALARAAYRCQVCYAQGRLDVHHRTYKRLGQEKQSDLTVLCETCHGLFHERLPQPR